MAELGRFGQTRIILNRPGLAGLFGCAGCLAAIFIGGGLLGVLIFGWRVLLG